MRYIRPFDPWKSKLCTCGEKYSFNPYTGCAHGCLYCYATYIPRFFQVRTKRNVFKELERDLRELPSNALISMSNSSDPYPPIERRMEITRRCLRIIKEYDFPLLIVTKSDIVVRDLDIISEMRCAVSITITGCDKLEPNAPPTEKRIEAFRRIVDANIPAILRFDPIVPGLNEDKLWIIEKCNPGHVVASTLKLKPDGFVRISKRFPDLAEKLREIYSHGERIGSYRYLPKAIRLKLLSKVANLCDEFGISWAFCREGLQFKAPSCDGSHLIMKRDIYHSKNG